MGRILRISLIVFAGFFILLVLTPGKYHFFVDDTEELAMRTGCRGYQAKIYGALKKYHLKRDALPERLSELVKVGYLGEDELYCPTARRYEQMRCYHYFPENYGKQDKVLIGEDDDNHSMKGRRRRTLPPAVNEIMGDGTGRKRNPQVQR